MIEIPFVVEVASSVAVAVAVCGNMKLLVVPVAAVRLPVQLAPFGQQAMLFAASRAQWASIRQQTLRLLRFEQGL